MNSHMHGPIQTLVAEHDLILRGTAALSKVLARDQRGGRFSQSFYERALLFFSDFVERVHHAKEERVLFPELELNGIAVIGGPIGWMLEEHVAGKVHIELARKALRDVAGGDADAREVFRREAAALVNLTKVHIEKENGILFRMAERVLGTETADYVAKRFESTERAAGEDADHVRFVSLVEGMEREADPQADLVSRKPGPQPISGDRMRRPSPPGGPSNG